MVLVECPLESFEQREGVRRPAGETRQNGVIPQPAHLDGVALHDGVAHRNLSVAAKHDIGAASDGNDGRSVELIHGVGCLNGETDSGQYLSEIQPLRGPRGRTGHGAPLRDMRHDARRMCRACSEGMSPDTHPSTTAPRLSGGAAPWTKRGKRAASGVPFEVGGIPDRGGDWGEEHRPFHWPRRFRRFAPIARRPPGRGPAAGAQVAGCAPVAGGHTPRLPGAGDPARARRRAGEATAIRQQLTCTPMGFLGSAHDADRGTR